MNLDQLSKLKAKSSVLHFVWMIICREVFCHPRSLLKYQGSGEAYCINKLEEDGQTWPFCFNASIILKYGMINVAWISECYSAHPFVRHDTLPSGYKCQRDYYHIFELTLLRMTRCEFFPLQVLGWTECALKRNRYFLHFLRYNFSVYYFVAFF